MEIQIQIQINGLVLPIQNNQCHLRIVSPQEVGIIF